MIWHNACTNPPPPNVDVLLAVEGEEESSEGFLVGGAFDAIYVYSDGHQVPRTVYAWTELPKCPVISTAGAAA